MRLSDIVTPAAIAAKVSVGSKAHVLKFAASSLAARSGLDAERIRQALEAREALGSTGIGRGIALPHVCFSELERAYALLCTLTSPINFDAIDGKPVDLVFTIISPCGSDQAVGGALSYLAAFSRFIRNDAAAASLRKAHNSKSIYDTIINASEAAAQLVS